VFIQYMNLDVVGGPAMLTFVSHWPFSCFPTVVYLFSVLGVM